MYISNNHLFLGHNTENDKNLGHSNKYLPLLDFPYEK